MPNAPLAEEIVEFIASGVDAYVATHDRELEPESMLAMGLRASPERNLLTVYVPEALSQVTCRNLEDNGQIAVTAIRPSDFKAVQIKGTSVRIRSSGELDRELQAVFRAALVEQFEIVGIPRAITRRLVWWPSLAIEFGVREIFLQTPGPRAGEPLRSR
jgi:hypothetical protein